MAKVRLQVLTGVTPGAPRGTGTHIGHETFPLSPDGWERLRPSQVPIYVKAARVPRGM